MTPARVATHCSAEGIVSHGYRNRRLETVINRKTERVELTGNRKAESMQTLLGSGLGIDERTVVKP